MEIKFSKIVDLTLPIDITMATYPGETILYRPVKTIPKDKHNVHIMHIFTHTGSHIDVPNHVIAEGQKIEHYPPEQFIGRALKIDLTRHTKELSRCGGTMYLKTIEKRHLQEFESKLRQVEAVLLQTGYGEVLTLGRQFIDMEFPRLTEDAARFLAQFNLKIIGIDSLTIDAHEQNTAHLAILSKGRALVLETLVNLEKCPEHFTLICLPLSIKDADGSPCRAIALV